MRLIDADELLEYFADAPDMSFENFHTPISTLRQLIADMPTIAPESLRPVGRWHLNEDGKWACTYCDGLAVEHPDKPDEWQALTRYCPHCGARMEGETK